MPQQLHLDDARLAGRRSLDRIERAWRPILASIGSGFRAENLTTAQVTAYAQERLAEGLRPASVYQEVAALRRGLRLAHRSNLLDRVPAMPPISVRGSRFRTGSYPVPPT